MKQLKNLLIFLYYEAHNLFKTKGWLKAEVLFLMVGLVLSVLALMGFASIAEEVVEKDTGPFDAQISHWVFGYRTQELTQVMLFITELGSRNVYIGIIVVAALLLHYIGHFRWMVVLEVCLVLLLSGILNRVLKFGFTRPRPTDFQLVTETSWSFPSGHSMTAMAFYGFLLFLLWRHRVHVWWRWPLSVLLALVILLVGTSRIYLGVHYPTDVLAGYAAGLFWVTLSGTVFQWVRNSRNKIKTEKEFASQHKNPPILP